jgi:hypothetical protein
VNKNSTVQFQMLDCQSNRACDFEIYGRSQDLALGEVAWVERHRVFVNVGFDGKQTLSISVSDHEAMVRTTRTLYPIDDRLFEYIPRQFHQRLTSFQQNLSRAITDQIKISWN